MRLLYILSMLAVLPLSAADPSKIDLQADKVTHEGAEIRGAGHARTKIGEIALQGDEATLHSDTNDVEFRGHVHVALPARSDHTLFRYGASSLVTDQPVVVTADRLTVKNGVLVASGNILVIPEDPDFLGAKLHADELSMILKTADATLRGKFAERAPSQPGFAPRYIFPPDIIK